MSIRQSNICLILTASIIPNTNHVAVKNIKERRNQYLLALKYYREIFKGTIYFLENSTYDFSSDKEFLELSDKNIHLIKFNISDENNRGKGYLEFKMLDDFFSQYTIKESYFFKITGRYLVKNLNKLIPLDYITIVADAHKKMQVTLTGVFFSKVDDFKKEISGLYKYAYDDKGIFIEHVLYQRLTKKGKTHLFNVNPVIEGVSGSSGSSLRRNPLKMKIRQVERKLLNTFNINQFLIEY
jgi:hypothetical protein